MGGADLLIYLFISGVICGGVTLAIGQSRGDGTLTFWRGAIWGPLGIAYALVMPGRNVKCDQCMKYVDREASICPYCRTKFEAGTYKK